MRARIVNRTNTEWTTAKFAGETTWELPIARQGAAAGALPRATWTIERRGWRLAACFRKASPARQSYGRSERLRKRDGSGVDRHALEQAKRRAPASRWEAPHIHDPDGTPGGAKGDRTPDLGIANAALSQLSYRPFSGGVHRRLGF